MGSGAVTDRCFGGWREAVREASASLAGATSAGKELTMALLPSTLGRAAALSSDVLDLQVAEHGPHVRVVSVGGEIDALSAPDLGALLSAQLTTASLVVVDLERVRFLGSAGLSVLFAAKELATRENRFLWLVVPRRGTVHRALEVTGLGERFNVAETVAAALMNSF